MSAEYTGPHGEYTGPVIGDIVSVSGRVVELASRGGVLGAVVDVGGGAAPVWLPLSQLTVTERRERGER